MKWQKQQIGLSKNWGYTKIPMVFFYHRIPVFSPLQLQQATNWVIHHFGRSETQHGTHKESTDACQHSPTHTLYKLHFNFKLYNMPSRGEVW